MSTKKQTIVIAEDEKFLLKAYRIGLEKEGYEVFIAEDGKTAVKLIQDHKPDLILLDVMMPRMNGYEVIKKIQERPELKAIPVVILSNLSQTTDQEIGKSLGVKDYIIKSDHSLKEVVEKVKGYLK